MWLEFCLLFGVVCLWLNYMRPKPPGKFPPGPYNFPFVGGALGLLNLPGFTATSKMRALGEKFGPISGLYFGKTPTIVINSFELVKEVSDTFFERPSIIQVDYLYGEKALGVFFSNGELWKQQRRFTLRNLRDFGFGKSSLQHLIHEEADETLRSILKDRDSNGVTSIHDKFGVSVINILWATMAGQRFSHDDEKLQYIMKVIWDNFRSGNSAGNFFNDYPFLRFIPIINRPWKMFVRSFQAVQDVLNEAVKEHKATRDQHNPRDFLDVYLEELESDKRKEISDSTFSEKQLLALCQDLFNAGAESTSNTIAFGIMYMILYPEAQDKVQEELDRVVGQNRLPSVEDKPNLPYCESVLTECYRITPIAPTAVPKTVKEDTKFHGFVIPKNAMILPVLESCHMDKSFWGDPEVFRPERFLDSQGNFMKAKTERVVAFGMGKRACLGEPLARMSTFLIFTALMQKLKFEIPEGSSKPTTVPVDGFTVAPQPFSAKVTSRI